MIAPQTDWELSREELYALLDQVRRSGSIAARSRILEAFRPLAAALAGTHPASQHVGGETVFNFALEGIARAIARYDFDQGVRFEYFVKRYARFAIADGLREQDHLTRTQRRDGVVPVIESMGERDEAAPDCCDAGDARSVEVHDTYDYYVGRAPLDWPQRLVVRLYGKEGWSIKDIAQHFRCGQPEVQAVFDDAIGVILGKDVARPDLRSLPFRKTSEITQDRSMERYLRTCIQRIAKRGREAIEEDVERTIACWRQHEGPHRADAVRAYAVRLGLIPM